MAATNTEIRRDIADLRFERRMAVAREKDIIRACREVVAELQHRIREEEREMARDRRDEQKTIAMIDRDIARLEKIRQTRRKFSSKKGGR